MKEKKQGAKPTPERASGREVGLVLVLGLLSALIIQRGFSPEKIVGGFFVSVLLLVLVYKDIMRYKPIYFRDFKMLSLLGGLLITTMAVSSLSEYSLLALSKGLGVGLAGAVAFGLPVPIGAMLVTLLFDFHTAMIFSFVISVLMGLWQGDAGIAVYAFVGSLVAAFSVIHCKRRSAILVGGLYVLAANIFTIFVLLLFEGQFLSLKTPVALALGLISALGVIALVSLALPTLEWMFKVTTDISLLELLDLDQPLMKSLMINSPGTYHHSIILGNLVDAVADSVGVNPLFARVCAYFHDIGKVKMPEYFIENQGGGINKHEKLTPHMSSMILISHVKEGVELARQHKLPEPVIDIIRQHHGTTVIAYFFEKAKAMPNGTELSEEEYRYPGPKPQSRVAALIMIADAVEAASRVLNDPTPSRISALVDKIINHIFLAGQLDECELTLKDIYEIRKRFTYILTGILHRRIEYPGFDFDKGASSHDGHDKQPAKNGKAKPERDRTGLPENPQFTSSPRDRA